MKWPLIFLLSLFGLVMAFGTVYFIPFEIEPFCWIAIFIVSAFIIVKYCTEKYFLNGFAVSIVNAVWMTVLHLSFFTTYTTSHGKEMEIMQYFPMPDDPQLMMFFMGIISGATSGLLLGLLSLAIATFIKKKRVVITL